METCCLIMNEFFIFAAKHLQKKNQLQNKEVVEMGDLQQENL